MIRRKTLEAGADRGFPGPGQRGHTKAEKPWFLDVFPPYYLSLIGSILIKKRANKK